MHSLKKINHFWIPGSTESFWTTTGMKNYLDVPRRRKIVVAALPLGWRRGTFPPSNSSCLSTQIDCVLMKSDQGSWEVSSSLQSPLWGPFYGALAYTNRVLIRLSPKQMWIRFFVLSICLFFKTICLHIFRHFLFVIGKMPRRIYYASSW